MKRPGEGGDTSVIDENVYAPECLFDFGCKRFNRSQVAHVAGDGLRAPTSPRDLRGRRLQAFECAPAQHEARAQSRKPLCDGRANAATGAGYDGYLSLKPISASCLHTLRSEFSCAAARRCGEPPIRLTIAS